MNPFDKIHKGCNFQLSKPGSIAQEGIGTVTDFRLELSIANLKGTRPQMSPV